MLAVGLPGCPKATRNVAGAGTRNQLPGRHEVGVGVGVGVPRQVAGPALRAFCFSLTNCSPLGPRGFKEMEAKYPYYRQGYREF